MTYDDCSFCGGKVTERRVQKACWWGDKLIAVIDNVPAGVCKQCGERYYTAAVLKEVETLLKQRVKFDTQIQIPFTDFAKVSTE
jgi:YgiT-type zinc finger domain-containing protein